MIKSVFLRFFIFSIFAFVFFSVSFAQTQQHLNGSLSSLITHSDGCKDGKHSAKVNFVVPQYLEAPEVYRGFTVTLFPVGYIQFQLESARGVVQGSMRIGAPFEARIAFADTLACDKIKLSVKVLSVEPLPTVLLDKKLVDQYYEAASEFDRIEAKANSIYYKDPSTLDAAIDELAEVDSWLDVIDRKKIPQLLPLKDSDPAHFVSQYSHAKDVVNNVAGLVESARRNWPQMFYHKAQRYSGSDREEYLKKSVSKAEEFKIVYAEPYFDLAQTYLYERDYDNARDYLYRFMALRPSYSDGQQAVVLMRRVFDAYVNSAQQHDGEAAIADYYMAQDMAKRFPEVGNLAMVTDRIKAIRSGLFDRDITEALTHESFQDLDKLRAYRDKYTHELYRPEALDEAIANLWQLHADRLFGLIQQNQTDRAFDLLKQMEHLRHQFSVPLPYPTQLDKAYAALYDQYRLRVEQQLASQKFEAAALATEQLAAIVAQNPISQRTPNEIPDYFRSAYGGRVIQGVREVEVAISKTQFDTALRQMESLKTYAATHAQWVAPEQIQQLDDLRVSLHSESFAFQLKTVTKLSQGKRFAEAEAAMQALRTYSKTYAEWMRPMAHGQMDQTEQDLHRNHFDTQFGTTTQLWAKSKIEESQAQLLILADFYTAHKSWLQPNSEELIRTQAVKLSAKLTEKSQASLRTKQNFVAERQVKLAMDLLPYTDMNTGNEAKNQFAAVNIAFAIEATRASRHADAAGFYSKAQSLFTEKAPRDAVETDRTKSWNAHVNQLLAAQIAEANRNPSSVTLGENAGKYAQTLSECSTLVGAQRFQLDAANTQLVATLSEIYRAENCVRVSRLFQANYRTALAKVPSGNFSTISTELREALALVKANEACQIDTLQVASDLRLYALGERFEKLTAARERALAQQDWPAVVTFSDDIEKLRNYPSQMAQLKLKPTEASEYILANPQPDLLAEALALNATRLSDTRASLYLQNILNQKPARKYLKALGNRIGTLQAQKFGYPNYKDGLYYFKTVEPSGRSYRRFKSGYKSGYKAALKK
ncbi:MAG: hypothetical protein RIS47_2118 [Bacteroidota bacterium]|jgi:hypothetical protein